MGSPEMPSPGCIYSVIVLAVIGVIGIVASLIWGTNWLINHVHFS